MSIQIENGVKSVVSAALAALLTLIVVTSISGGTGLQRVDHKAQTAYSTLAGDTRHAG